MDKLVEMAIRVLSTGRAEEMSKADTAVMYEEYYRSVQAPIENLRREQAAALDEYRFVTCR